MQHLFHSSSRVIWQQIAVALIWGSAWVVGRFITDDVPALVAAGWRAMFAAIILGALLWRTERQTFLKVSLKDFFGIAVMGIFGIFGYTLCFFYGLQFIEAGRGALVTALNPIAVAVAGSLVMGEAWSKKSIAGAIIALAGCLTVLGHGNPLILLDGGLGWGELLMIGCVLSWTIYTLVGRKLMQNLTPLAMTFYATVVGGLMLWALGWVLGTSFFPSHLSIESWLLMAYLGAIGSGIAYAWYANGIQQLGASKAAMFINLVPLAALLLGWAFLNEKIDLGALVGGGLIIGGVWITQYAKRKAAK